MFLWVPYISPLLMRVFSLPVILQFLSWPFITFFFMLLSLSNWFPISNLWLLCDDPALLARLLLFFFCKLLKLTFLLLKIHTIYHEWHKNTTIGHLYLLCSVQFSRSVVSDSLWPHELQHARPPCPSPTPRVHSDSLPLSQWRHSAISS